jgi:hypothetical protein
VRTLRQSLLSVEHVHGRSFKSRAIRRQPAADRAAVHGIQISETTILAVKAIEGQ